MTFALGELPEASVDGLSFTGSFSFSSLSGNSSWLKADCIGIEEDSIRLADSGVLPRKASVMTLNADLGRTGVCFRASPAMTSLLPHLTILFSILFFGYNHSNRIGLMRTSRTGMASDVIHPFYRS